ncbi:hypothetical protein B4113_1035 [Geobacillus sp. B4113_201601]|nr:hypothetical protein B4113_1035 [Geobacillus sp. B4113_201601]
MLKDMHVYVKRFDMRRLLPVSLLDRIEDVCFLYRCSFVFSFWARLDARAEKQRRRV